MGSVERILAGLASGFALIALAACSDSDPFDGVTPMATGERPVTSFADDYAFASGIWRIDGEHSAFPYNVTEIWCWREGMTCSSASAELQEFNGSKFLAVAHAVSDVDLWSNTEIVFSSSGGCRTATTKLSKKDGAVVQTVETDFTLPSCTEGVREGVMGEALERPRVIRMITTDEWQRRQDDGLE